MINHAQIGNFAFERSEELISDFIARVSDFAASIGGGLVTLGEIESVLLIEAAPEIITIEGGEERESRKYSEVAT